MMCGSDTSIPKNTKNQAQPSPSAGQKNIMYTEAKKLQPLPMSPYTTFIVTYAAKRKNKLSANQRKASMLPLHSVVYVDGLASVLLSKAAVAGVNKVATKHAVAANAFGLKANALTATDIHSLQLEYNIAPVGYIL
jgi:hypothetical protein